MLELKLRRHLWHEWLLNWLGSLFLSGCGNLLVLGLEHWSDHLALDLP